ncbi:protein phosphatase 1 regulatory subunit 1C isoform X3 [Gopherus evgoodei]|uniref:protein phosphatase 1 regulatory subunit 1C isoform X3 n=1 Tax=Gopherus evgoodei TaxID=1825980 RepID=UPI0011CEFEF6|nr:protein phosphatase 1 regulatory subunit 1C isoform X3 [Gopherus evgoodei]
MEPNSPKKIQFAVPLFQSQIDPEAAEQIRKRRPTPASLVIMNEHSPSEIDEKRKSNSQGESQNASPKQRKQSVYTPPAIKGTVQAVNRQILLNVMVITTPQAPYSSRE